MNAIVHRHYGSPDLLTCEDISKPVPGDGEVLIGVRAASVNPLDWHFMRGEPRFIRLMTGIGKPKDTRIGVDLAGLVEAVGKNVTRFHPGDEVLGAGKGAFAEYACAREKSLARKPARITFEQAAAVPIAACTALQALRDKGRLQSGQKVLINGASGGVGTFAVQIAKAFGATVTAVCSTRNVEMVRSLGADHVVDYTREDFTRSGQPYDLGLELVGNRTLRDWRRVLSPTGTLVLAGGNPNGSVIGTLVFSAQVLLLNRLRGQKLIMFMASVKSDDLALLANLLESAKVTPAIDHLCQLSEVPEAIRYLEERHARGKVVVTVSHA